MKLLALSHRRWLEFENALLIFFKVKLVFKNAEIVAESEESDKIITALRIVCTSNFAGIPETNRFKLDITPPTRLFAKIFILAY